MSNFSTAGFEAILRHMKEEGLTFHAYEKMPIPLEKYEICELYGLSLHEMNKELSPIMEKVGWIKGGRQKIKPYGLKLIYRHFYGEEEGWKAFYTSMNGEK